MERNEPLFLNNCELWAKFNPKEALLVPYLDTKGTAFLSPGDTNEADNWFKGLELEGVFVLIVYGIGLGFYYEAAKEWLKMDPSRRLVFLEDDLAAMRQFLESSSADVILQDPQVQILYFKDVKDNEAVLEVLYWNFAMTRLLVSALNSYAYEKKEIFAELHQKIAYDFAVKNALVEEYLKFGGAFFINFYQNMLDLPGSFLGNKTFGSFRGVPAIICGAGPSLEKSFEVLSGLDNRALIFAGGSALNALNAAGLQPHLGAGIDPNPAQFERLKSNQAFEVPFYYRNRMHHGAFSLIHGPRLYITGCGGYDIADWFEEKLDIKSDFMDEGHNVINFCLQIAFQLGCNPIIFSGMDLGFTDLKAYAPGIEKEVEFDPNKALLEEDYDSKPILRKDIEGKPLYTLWKWLAEAEWIGDFSKEHPEVVIINCTEGGLGFPGVPNEPLKEVAEQYLARQYPILDRLNGEIQNSALPQATLPEMIHMTQELQESLKSCVLHFNILIEETEKLQSKILKENRVPETLQSGRAALSEIELADEPGYQFVLDIFNAVQTRILSRELHESKMGPELEQIIKKQELNIKRFVFLRDVAKFNVEVIDHALEVKNQEMKEQQNSNMTADKEFPMKETQIPDFHPILLPESPEEGQMLDKEHCVRVFKQYGKPADECRVEKDGVLDGQCLLYYPDGKIKAESFYKKGHLHGPSIFYSHEGHILSKSAYVDGKLEGESRWYYLSGGLYAIQNNQGGKLEGVQKYFYPNGKLKTLVTYNHGKVEGKVHLYGFDGSIQR